MSRDHPKKYIHQGAKLYTKEPRSERRVIYLNLCKLIILGYLYKFMPSNAKSRNCGSTI